MTTDERIEKLLNRFGQTVIDLPKSDTLHLAYGRDSRLNAEYRVFVFAGRFGQVDSLDCLAMHQDYICHLADVIDRMEAALETAANTMDCRRCERAIPDCNFNCNEHSKVADWQLSGMCHYEFKEFVEGEGQKDA